MPRVQTKGKRSGFFMELYMGIAMPIPCQEREFFIDNLLVRIHFIIAMIWWTGLAPWEFEFPANTHPFRD